MKQPAGSWPIRVAVKSLAGSLLLPANTGSSPAVRLQLTAVLHARVFGWDLATQTSKSCIDFNEFDVTMAREKWKKSHSNILKPFKEALRPRDHCPSLFFIEVKERRGLSSRWIFARPTTRCFATYLAGTTKKSRPNLQKLHQKIRKLSAIPICVPARHSNTSDPTCRQRRVEEEAKSNTSFVYVSRRTSKFCNSM